MIKPLFLVLVCLVTQAQDLSRMRIYKALLVNKVLDPDRELVHLSEACSLHLSGKIYSVIDLQELVKGASTPRGVNRIVVLDPALRPVRTLPYGTERPLFCLDNKLFVYGDLAIDNVEPAGNVLIFSNGGHDVALSHVEANNYPIPMTKDRKAAPQ